MCTPSRQWPFSSRVERDRVVEVAGIDRVDRDDRLAGQIEPIADRLVERVGLLAGIFQHVFGKLLGQAEFADDRERIDARRALRTEHFDDHRFARMADASESGPSRSRLCRPPRRPSRRDRRRESAAAKTLPSTSTLASSLAVPDRRRRTDACRVRRFRRSRPPAAERPPCRGPRPCSGARGPRRDRRHPSWHWRGDVDVARSCRRARPLRPHKAEALQPCGGTCR